MAVKVGTITLTCEIKSPRAYGARLKLAKILLHLASKLGSGTVTVNTKPVREYRGSR